jgi:peroxiredoxin (alkyl hydroperoxide reductase subunit C)
MSLVGKILHCSRRHLRNGWQLENKYFEEAINNNKKVLLFWYPKDFTFVCPTELHAFKMLYGIWKRNTIVIGAFIQTKYILLG